MTSLRGGSKGSGVPSPREANSLTAARPGMAARKTSGSREAWNHHGRERAGAHELPVWSRMMEGMTQRLRAAKPRTRREDLATR